MKISGNKKVVLRASEEIAGHDFSPNFIIRAATYVKHGIFRKEANLFFYLRPVVKSKESTIKIANGPASSGWRKIRKAGVSFSAAIIMRRKGARDARLILQSIGDCP